MMVNLRMEENVGFCSSGKLDGTLDHMVCVKLLGLQVNSYI
jgi:hypothetical protein